MIYGLGKRLQQQRILKNLSQRQVADAVGVSASIISNYETGERTPSLEILIALASLFHCSTDYLLGFTLTDCSKLLDVSMLNEKQIQFLQHFLYTLKE